MPSEPEQARSMPSNSGQGTPVVQEKIKIFQYFRDSNNKDLLECIETHRFRGDYYIFWKEVQEKFTNNDHLQKCLNQNDDTNKEVQKKFSNIDHLQKCLNQNDDTNNRGVRVLYETEALQGL